jgi:hypothetical protein
MSVNTTIGTAIGFDGSVAEGDWTWLSTAGVSDYGVVSDTDWAVTAKAASDRTVRVAAGRGWGKGIADATTTILEKQFPIQASGVRYDMLVLRRVWNGSSPGNTTLEIVTGSSSNTTLPARNSTRGATDDQPIALVRISSTSQLVASDIIDLRVWAINGGAVARSTLVLQYLDRPGTTLYIGGVTYRRIVNAAGAGAWETDEKPADIVRNVSGGAVSGISANAYLLTYGSGETPVDYARRVQGYAIVDLAGANPGAAYRAVVTKSGAQIDTNVAEHARLPFINQDAPYAVGGSATVPFDFEVPANGALQPRVGVERLGGGVLNVARSKLFYRVSAL